MNYSLRPQLANEAIAPETRLTWDLFRGSLIRVP
jgi:hypothetical protein